MADPTKLRIRALEDRVAEMERTLEATVDERDALRRKVETLMRDRGAYDMLHQRVAALEAHGNALNEIDREAYQRLDDLAARVLTLEGTKLPPDTGTFKVERRVEVTGSFPDIVVRTHGVLLQIAIGSVYTSLNAAEVRTLLKAVEAVRTEGKLRR